MTPGGITLGGDPEFVLWDPIAKTVVPMNQVFPVDSNYEMYRLTSEVGVDGNERIGELRFPYVTNPADVALRIKERLQILQQKLNDKGIQGMKGNRFASLEVRGGTWFVDGLSHSYPLGGHIHFGHSELSSHLNPVRRIQLLNRLIFGLDKYLAIPLAAVENPVSAKCRMSTFGYGKPACIYPDAHRDQPWGMEYRTTYSWIQSPMLTNAAFGLAWLVGTNAFNLLISDEQWIYADAISIKNPLLVRKLRHLRWLARKNLTELEGITGYKEVESLIMPLRELIESERIVRMNTDALVEWGIRT